MITDNKDKKILIVGFVIIFFFFLFLSFRNNHKLNNYEECPLDPNNLTGQTIFVKDCAAYLDKVSKALNYK